MTDLEISRALALAIGWDKTYVRSFNGFDLWVYDPLDCDGWRLFDYRHPMVIWPIAERYKAFPNPFGSGWVVIDDESGHWHKGDTASKAVALAVIGGRDAG